MTLIHPATAPERRNLRPEAGAPLSVLFLGKKPYRRLLNPPTMQIDNQHYRPMGKPNGGLWTCREEVPGYTPWLTHPASRRGYHIRIWRLVAPAPRLLVIDDDTSFNAALDQYGRDFLSSIRDREPLMPDHLSLPELDHEAILAAGYDGVELTMTGRVAGMHAEDWRRSTAVSGWDVACVLWYRWAFRGRPERVSTTYDLRADMPEEDDDDD